MTTITYFFFDEFYFSLKAVYDLNGKHEGTPCMYVCVCMCVCMYVCVYVRMYVCVCMRVFFYIYLFCMLHYSEQHYMHWWFLTLSLMYI